MTMIYEEERMIEEQENKAREQKIATLLAEVAPYLPQGWIFVDRNQEVGHSWFRFKNLNIKGEICLSTEWNHKDKLSLSGSYPKDRQGNSYDVYEQKRPSISFSINKTALAIAKDIERRFLPDYLALLDKIKGRISEYETHLDKLSSLGEYLFSELPYLKLNDTTRGLNWHGNPNRGGEVSLGCGWADMKCYDNGRVSLKLDGLTAEEIIKVMGILKGARK